MRPLLSCTGNYFLKFKPKYKHKGIVISFLTMESWCNFSFLPYHTVVIPITIGYAIYLSILASPVLYKLYYRYSRNLLSLPIFFFSLEHIENIILPNLICQILTDCVGAYLENVTTMNFMFSHFTVNRYAIRIT